MGRIKQIAKKNNYRINKIYHFKEDIINLKKIKIFIQNFSLNKILKTIKSSYKKKFEYNVFEVLLDAIENLLIQSFINSKIENSKNQIDSYELMKEREIQKTIETGNFIDYVYKIKRNQQELLLVIDNIGNIILYDLKTFEKLFKIILYSFDRILSLSELDNNIILISLNYSLEAIIIEKDEFNKFFIYKIIDDIFEVNQKVIKILKLQSNDILFLYKTSFSIFTSNYLKEKMCYKIGNSYFENNIKKLLPNYINILTHFTSKKNENLDVIELNKDIIVYYNLNFCNIYSMNNKQIIFSIKVNVSPFVDDVLKKISDDIFCIGEKNIIEFISIKLGKVIDKIIFPNSVSICATGLLKNNNILIGSVIEDNNFVRKLYLTQFQYFINNKDENNIIHINFNCSMILGHGLGNIFIIELDDGRILFTSKDSIFFLNK